ncbi:hypothetical protein BT96DRAFT_1006472 [Gymnopus androsaceus JB14]|uniref:Uncharacterized protein n=1 Tax=Gymnopus androsaceus JB14 TaxID=1447944 RepID=A0A6A4GKH0_9AGAR|nr:hypothetical protein BT96DRAFT_1006472 [Gymnopus androsaceus JB14]
MTIPAISAVGENSTHKLHIPAIVGGVVSGIVTLIIVALLLFIWNQRQKHVLPSNQFGVSPFTDLRDSEAIPTSNMEESLQVDNHTTPLALDDDVGIFKNVTRHGHCRRRIARKVGSIPKTGPPPEEQPQPTPAPEANQRMSQSEVVEEKDLHPEESMPVEVPHAEVEEVVEHARGGCSSYEESERRRWRR